MADNALAVWQLFVKTILITFSTIVCACILSRIIMKNRKEAENTMVANKMFFRVVFGNEILSVFMQ